MIKQLSILALVTFLLHMVWENLHIGLYGGYEELTGLHITLYATIGDVLYTLGAVLLVALFKKNFEWMSKVKVYDLAGLAIIGFFISLFVEYKAFAFDRWFYLDTMPIIPYLDVGLSPVVQMSVLLPLSVWLTGRVVSNISSIKQNG